MANKTTVRRFESICPICGKRREITTNNPTRRCLSCAVKEIHENNRKKVIQKGVPLIGEYRRGYELGTKDRGHPYIFSKCPVCGVERWITYRGNKSNPYQRCQKCSAVNASGEKHWNWKGGRIKHSEGYIDIKLHTNDFYYPMANKSGYVAEHRLVMAKSLNRCLLPWEVVHHKNGIREDNRIENLELLPTRKFHIVDTQIKSLVAKQKVRINYLEMILKKEGVNF